MHNEAHQAALEIEADRRRADELTLVEFSQSLPVMLMRAREAVMGRIRPILRGHEVTEQQWRVLRTLACAGELEVTQLAERVFMRPPSLSRILRDLADRRLLLRRTSKTDLRRNLVSIAPAGLALIDETGPEVARATAEIQALYGPAKVEQLRGLLAELERVLLAATGSPSGRRDAAADE
jgi:homoprotocatechuate degradation regulator HpaR